MFSIAIASQHKFLCFVVNLDYKENFHESELIFLVLCFCGEFIIGINSMNSIYVEFNKNFLGRFEFELRSKEIAAAKCEFITFIDKNLYGEFIIEIHKFQVISFLKLKLFY